MLTLILMQFLAILPLSILCGIFGSITSWNQSAFFSHVLSHSLLLPVAMGAALGLTDEPWLTMLCLVFAVIFAIICFRISITTRCYGTDSVFMITSCICLAIAIIISNRNANDTDVMLYMAGDILLLQPTDIAILYILAIVVPTYLIFFWRTIILQVCNHDIAYTANNKTNTITMMLWMLQAIFIAIGIKMVGVLLISAAVVMPAFIARMFASSPQGMIVLAICCAFVVMCTSSFLSFIVNVQIAPIIVVAYALLWLACHLYQVKYTQCVNKHVH